MYIVFSSITILSNTDLILFQDSVPEHLVLNSTQPNSTQDCLLLQNPEQKESSAIPELLLIEGQGGPLSDLLLLVGKDLPLQ